MNTACSGVIKLEPLMNYLKQYKDGLMTEQIEQGNSLPNHFKYLHFLSIIVLQAFQDQAQLNSAQFFDLIIGIYQSLNESNEGVEKYDDILKYVDNFQPQVILP